MSLANVAYAATLAWANPALFALEEQALIPMFAEFRVELGLAGREGELFDRLRADPRYQRMFAEAFPGAGDLFSLATITMAISSFERTLISGNSAYDRYVFGDDNAISDSALRGQALFFDETRECFHCHAFGFDTFFFSFIDLDGILYFAAEDVGLGAELWLSDGTEAGTRIIRDIRSGVDGSHPAFFTAVGSHLFFQVCDAAGCDPWRTDGTEPGPERIADIAPGDA